MPFGQSFFIGAPARPRLVKSLRILCAEIDALWPIRPWHLDGWIGDKAHQNRVSDHNPDRSGVVRAIDVTALGIETKRLYEACRRHPAASYMIFDGRIWSADGGWIARPYSGPNAHADHVHISVVRGPAAYSSRSWGLG